MLTSNSILFEVFVIIFHLSMITCSLVIDSAAQQGVYVTDYCPKMEYCPEGSHVMCMYYNPKSVMGPRCANPKNLTMRPELASKMLDISNEIRSKLAKGNEKGKKGESLPRAYGMFRLKWDTELATFAQVLANQCVLRHDLCRATRRFPNPGQTAGLVRFSIPDWFPISKSGNFSTPGLSLSKLFYATNMVIKSWYGQKSSVTPSMVTNYPDWTLNPSRMQGRLYLEMVYGSATHMGCGISAYTEYAFHDNNAALNYNSVMIICNYSARPVKGTAIYNTVPPVDTSLTHCVAKGTCSAAPFSRCGCPVGSEEDEDCLCQVVDKEPAHQTLHLKDDIDQCPAGEVCDPTVVLLPIFTVEDAPPEKLFARDSYAISSLKQPIKDVGIFRRKENNFFENKRYGSMAEKIVNKPQAKYDSEAKAVQTQSRSREKPRPTNRQVNVVKNRYFGKKGIELKRVMNEKKKSIFNKAPIFELPTARIRPTKPVVIPRKDFSSAKQLVSNYLFGKNNFIKPSYKNSSMSDVMKMTSQHELKRGSRNDITVKDSEIQQSNSKRALIVESGARNMNSHRMNEVFNILKPKKPIQISKNVISYQIKHTTETILNTAEQSIINQDIFLQEILNHKNEYDRTTDTIIEKNYNKLIALLDTLEKEVKHAELHDNDKDLFDTKIRKIYGKVVGNPENLSKFKINENSTIQKSFQDPKEELMFEKYRMRMERPYDFGLTRNEKKSNYNLSNNPISHDHNDIDKYDQMTGLYKTRFNLRGIKHSEFSHEQLRNKYQSGNDHNLVDRKSFNDNDFDKNTFSDVYESRHLDTENMYRNRKGMPYQYRNNAFKYRNATNGIDNLHRNSEFRVRLNDHRIRNNNYYLANDANNDPLSVERRRFYQEKLDNIKSRVENRRNWNKQSKNIQRQTRPVLRTYESQMEYRHGNARYAHGYR